MLRNPSLLPFSWKPFIPPKMANSGTRSFISKSFCIPKWNLLITQFLQNLKSSNMSISWRHKIAIHAPYASNFKRIQREEIKRFIFPSIGFNTACIEGIGLADSGDNATLKRRKIVATTILISNKAKRWPVTLIANH